MIHQCHCRKRRRISQGSSPCEAYRITMPNQNTTLRWRQNGPDSVSNHQPHDCLLNRLFRRRSKKTSKLHVTGLCAGNSPGTGDFPAQMASYAENISIWWRHHDKTVCIFCARPIVCITCDCTVIITSYYSLSPRDVIWRHRMCST